MTHDPSIRGGAQPLRDALDGFPIGIPILVEHAPVHDGIAEIGCDVDLEQCNPLDAVICDLVTQNPGELFPELMCDSIRS